MKSIADGPVAVVNCGSSSVEIDLVDIDERASTILRVDHPLDDDHSHRAVVDAVQGLPDLAVVAHRMVHGGERLDPSPLDDTELARLRSISRLAPLHLPPAIRAAELIRSLLPDVPSFACFDTEFHAHLNPASRTLPVPVRWREGHGIHRYGFHGPGHHWATLRTAAMLDRPAEDLQLVTAHLGGGASAAAIRHGHSVDTTMGYTPLAGMAMGTRPGSLDPGVLLDLIERGSTIQQLTHEVNHDSGLAGLAGGRSDLRDLYPAAEGDDEHARLALDIYVAGIAQGIAAMATALDRLDAIAFTGGGGWGSVPLRMEVCARLATLDVRLDPLRNRGPILHDVLVHRVGSAVAVAVVHAEEAVIIARSALRAHHRTAS
jgi:acetate kinase